MDSRDNKSSEIYTIKALTNMHVGSGDINFGVIDNMVQRDVITKFPIINGSSLKGALRDYFSREIREDKEFVEAVFGGGATEQDSKGANNNSGDYKFFEAHLLALPVRSMERPYYLATCPLILKELAEYIKWFKGKKETAEALYTQVEDLELKSGGVLLSTTVNNQEKISVEDIIIQGKNIGDSESIATAIKSLFNVEELVILTDETFEKQFASNLPVLARNHLVNRKSENLWYEEIVPRETLFYMGICKQCNGRDSSVDFQEMEKYLLENPIQIGANASIGYGYTKFSILGECNNG